MFGEPAMLDVRKIEWLSRVAGEIDHVWILRIQTDAPCIIALALIQRPSRIGDHAFLPVRSRPPCVIIKDTVLGPIHIPAMKSDAEYANRKAVALISNLPTPRPSKRNMIVEIGSGSLAVQVNDGPALA